MKLNAGPINVGALNKALGSPVKIAAALLDCTTDVGVTATVSYVTSAAPSALTAYSTLTAMYSAGGFTSLVYSGLQTFTQTVRSSGATQLTSTCDVTAATAFIYGAATEQNPPVTSLSPDGSIVRWECTLYTGMSVSAAASVYVSNTCVLRSDVVLALAPGTAASAAAESTLWAQSSLAATLAQAAGFTTAAVWGQQFSQVLISSGGASFSVTVDVAADAKVRRIVVSWRDGRAYRVVSDTNIGGLLEGGMTRSEITSNLGTVGLM